MALLGFELTMVAPIRAVLSWLGSGGIGRMKRGGLGITMLPRIAGCPSDGSAAGPGEPRSRPLRSEAWMPTPGKLSPEAAYAKVTAFYTERRLVGSGRSSLSSMKTLTKSPGFKPAASRRWTSPSISGASALERPVAPTS